MIIDDNFELSFNFKSAGVCQTYKVGDLPKESILALLQYGTRKGNDAVNSAAAANPEKNRVALVDEWLDKLIKGELGQANRTNEDAQFKAFVVQALKANGMQAKALKGLNLGQLLDLCADKMDATTDKAEKALRAKYAKVQEAIKAANEAFTI